MVAAFPVFGLVVDGGAAVFKLHFRQRVVALEVGGVVLRVPQAEFDKAVQGELLRFGSLVGQGQTGDLGGIAPGHHDRLTGPQAVLGRSDAGVAGAHAAFIAVQRGLGGLPARIPDHVAFFEVEVVSARIGGDVVVAVAGHTQKPRVLVEGVAAGGVAHQGEEVLAAQIVDPWIGRVRSGNDIFAVRVVEMAVVHQANLHSVFRWDGKRKSDGRRRQSPSTCKLNRFRKLNIQHLQPKSKMEHDEKNRKNGNVFS